MRKWHLFAAVAQKNMILSGLVVVYVHKGENMQKLKVIIIGIVGAVVVSYFISTLYTRYKYPVSLPDDESSGRSVCIYENGQYDLMDAEEYIESVLLGTMQDDWNDEMLRVMAVILRTGVYYQMENQGEAQSGKSNLINETELREIRYTYSELKEKWGDGYKNASRRSKSAVSDTRGVVIRYEGQVILPAYHVVSVGHTVSAEELYGYDIPYLRQVDSGADRMASDFSTTRLFSEDRLRKIFDRWLTAEQDSSSDDMKILKATPSGFAITIDVFGAEVNASDFCMQLGLPSTNVHIDKPDDKYRVVSVGVGNSLGLSLYGAALLAANGESYKEIIQYYYNGVTVSR